MKLLRLILQGFKSFADRTEISFPEGITMIVGPNGCGKSNISDAVRWALGEQNVRNLRGERAQDIIFAGAASRRPKNGAEVTLVFDNAARELPLDTAEVSVRRRILRNGDSDFYINGRSCRLRDIQELFANTGLGKGSLAIIGQNRVDQVLSARPEERRLIFEEVAGISRYRMRKEEGLGKLSRTEENMERIRDLTAALSERLGPMEAAAEKTKQFRGLLAEKEAAELTASLLTLSSVRRMLARYETECRTLAEEKSRAETALSVLDAERADIEARGAAGENAYRKAAEEAAEAMRAAEKLHGDYRVAETSLSHAAEEIGRLSALVSGKKEAEGKLSAETREASEARTAAEARLASEKDQLAAAKAEKEAAEISYEEAERSHQSLLEEIRGKTARRESLLQELRHLSEEAERLSGEKAAADGERKAAEAEREKTRDAISSLETEAERRKARLSELESRGRAESRALAEGEKLSFSLLTKWNEAKSRLAQISSHRSYLERAEREYASFSNVTRTVLTADEPWQDHIRGALGELLRVPAEYTEAAEAALGGTVSYIVTDTSAAAADIIGWMKRRNAGRTTFYPLDAMRPRFSDGPEREALRETGVRGLASELFRCDREIEDLKKALLGRVVIVDTLENARRIAKKYNYRLHLVTLDGQIIRPGGSMTGGSMKKRENTFFGRKRELEDLALAAREAEAEISRFASERKACEEENAGLSDAVGRTREAWQAEHTAEAADAVRRDHLAAALRAAGEAAEAAEKAAEKAAAALSENEKKRREISKEEKEIGEIPALPEDEKLRGAKAAAEEAAGRVTTLLVSLARAEETLVRAKETETARRLALSSLRTEKEAAEKELGGEESARARLQKEIDALSGKFEETERLLHAAEERRDALRDGTDALAAERSENEEKRRAAQDALAEVSRRLTERELRAENERKLEEAELGKLRVAGLTEAEAEKRRLPGNGAAMAKKIAELSAAIDALGPVNPNAEREFELEKERLAGYETQLADLEKAKEGLEKVIRGIDTAMARDFTEAFEKINKEFGRILRTMFRGGSGTLSLTDPEHPLEAGVELYLELPGKKRQPLSLLSGGERALTVIALLISFLAYRPAPFCFVDEIDAALDDANVERFARMMADYKEKTQFIAITHRKKTMEFADTLQGVTMGEKGVSSLITVRMEDYVE